MDGGQGGGDVELFAMLLTSFLARRAFSMLGIPFGDFAIDEFNGRRWNEGATLVDLR